MIIIESKRKKAETILKKYPDAILADVRCDETDARHVAMAVNADMSTLIQLMDIGTPTNISQSR